MKAQYLFAIAENDDNNQPEAKDVLRGRVSRRQGLRAEIEVYAGAMHGWCPARFDRLPRGAGGAGVEPSPGSIRKRARVALVQRNYRDPATGRLPEHGS